MNNIDLSLYRNKHDGETLSASTWNKLMLDIEDAVNNVSGLSSVKLNGTTLIPDINKAVNINAVTSIKYNGEIVPLVGGIAEITASEKEEQEELEFYVNGVLTKPVGGIVKLDAGKTYTLKGDLLGEINIIDSVPSRDSTNPLLETSIILEGVNIHNPSNSNSAICYIPEEKSVYVTLADKTTNILKCTNIAPLAESQRGALHSNNNMVIQGTGELVVVNKGGHGIKASELEISGKPIIGVDAIHDGIHGNSLLNIYGGKFCIIDANDAFGTRAATLDKDGGFINIFGGEFEAYNIVQKVFDSKEEGYMFTNVSVKTNSLHSNIFSGIVKVDPKIYFGGAEFIVNDSGEAGYTETFGTVKCYTDEDLSEGETEIESVGGIYTLTTPYASISGYIEGTILAPLESTDITLDNAYIVGSIKYTPSKKKLQITSAVETFNFIISEENAVISGNNLTVEFKSKSYIGIIAGKTGLFGDEVTLTDSKGVLEIKECGEYGIRGKDIYVGQKAKSNDSTKKLWGTVFVHDNKEADIISILNSSHLKGNINVLNDGLVGTVVADNIEVDGYLNLNLSKRFFFKKIKGTTYGCVNIATLENI